MLVVGSSLMVYSGFRFAQMKEEAARQKERERREQAVDEARWKAEQEHAKRAAVIQAEVEAIEKRSQAEDAR